MVPDDRLDLIRVHHDERGAPPETSMCGGMNVWKGDRQDHLPGFVFLMCFVPTQENTLQPGIAHAKVVRGDRFLGRPGNCQGQSGLDHCCPTCLWGERVDRSVFRSRVLLRWCLGRLLAGPGTISGSYFEPSSSMRF